MKSSSDPETKNEPVSIRHFFTGLAMGGADIIPGVSGGTVALILGIYKRLISAISLFDGKFLRLLSQRKLADAFQYADLKFLIVLGSGAGVGIAALAKVMQFLLEQHRAITLSVFFGLILASSILVAKMIKPKSERQTATMVLLGITAAIFAFTLVGLGGFKPSPGYLYTFFSGAVAICAMILPGISGAYILLILGKYGGITEKIHNVTSFKASAADFTELTVLAAGCAVGLILFSKFLKWLLSVQYEATMAILCGFMLGSLRKIWPFQIDTTPEIEKLSHKVFKNIRITEWNGQVTLCLIVAVVALGAVLMIDHFARRIKHSMDKKPLE